MKKEKFLVKVNEKLIAITDSKKDLKTIVKEYEKKLYNVRYKKEYCMYNEKDGNYYGYHFTLYDYA